MEIICFPAGRYTVGNQTFKITCADRGCRQPVRRVIGHSPIDTAPGVQGKKRSPKFKSIKVEPCNHTTGYFVEEV